MSAAILAIEDNPDNMELFARILEDEKFAFTGVGPAEEGRVSLERGSFDLVLMDIALPGIDGKEATRRIRADPRFALMPVIAATAPDVMLQHLLACQQQLLIPCRHLHTLRWRQRLL